MDKPSSIHSRHHAVQFYENDSSLFATVAGFLSQGLVEGHPAILIATAEHTAAILDHLNSRMIDVAKARALGELTVLDAHQTLATFMVDDKPDPVRFESQHRPGDRQSPSGSIGAHARPRLWRNGRRPVEGRPRGCGHSARAAVEQFGRPVRVCPVCAATRWEISSSKPTASKKSAGQHTHIIPGSELNALPKRDRVN